MPVIFTDETPLFMVECKTCGPWDVRASDAEVPNGNQRPSHCPGCGALA